MLANLESIVLPPIFELSSRVSYIFKYVVLNIPLLIDPSLNNILSSTLYPP